MPQVSQIDAAGKIPWTNFAKVFLAFALAGSLYLNFADKNLIMKSAEAENSRILKRCEYLEAENVRLNNEKFELSEKNNRYKDSTNAILERVVAKFIKK